LHDEIEVKLAQRNGLSPAVQ